MNARVYLHTYIHMHACIETHTYTHMHTHTHACMHAYIQARTRAHTRTRTTRTHCVRRDIFSSRKFKIWSLTIPVTFVAFLVIFPYKLSTSAFFTDLCNYFIHSAIILVLVEVKKLPMMLSNLPLSICQCDFVYQICNEVRVLIM
jgi:hypothetical protein